MRSTIDTGASSSKFGHVSNNVYLRRRDELFARLRPSHLLRWMDNGGNDEGGNGGETKEGGNDENAAGGGGGTAADSILLLDLRDGDEFDACHLRHARNFPVVNLRRERYPPELFRARNRVGSIIVVYDLDERLAKPAATTFVEKGFENVYLLTGGLERFAAAANVLAAQAAAAIPEEGNANGRGALEGKYAWEDDAPAACTRYVVGELPAAVLESAASAAVAASPSRRGRSRGSPSRRRGGRGGSRGSRRRRPGSTALASRAIAAGPGSPASRGGGGGGGMDRSPYKKANLSYSVAASEASYGGQSVRSTFGTSARFRGGFGSSNSRYG